MTILCWDLDEHIGIFTELARAMEIEKGLDVYRQLEEMDGFDEPFHPVRAEMPSTVNVQVRQSMPLALETLASKGFRNYVTTSATQEYANRALEKTGLLKHFNGVVNVPSCSNGKDYSSMREYETHGMIIAFGHSLNDVPVDNACSVFVYDSDAVSHDAMLLCDLLEVVCKNRNMEYFPFSIEMLSIVNKRLLELKAEYNCSVPSSIQPAHNYLAVEVVDATDYLAKPSIVMIDPRK